MLPEAKLKE